MAWKDLPPGQRFILAAPADIPDPPMTSSERCAALKEARRLLQSKYDAGIPLFTKGLLRDVVRQLDSDDNPDQTISVTGLDGVAVSFPLKTGSQLPREKHPYGDDRICIITKPELSYRSAECLLDARRSSVSDAHLPFTISHSTEVRDAQTNELLDRWPTVDYATVKTRFELARRSFEDSSHFAQLKSTLAAVAGPLRINKVVAFACASMTDAEHHPTRRLAQHALAIAIRDFLASSSNAADADVDGEATAGGSIKCFAQDPIYTAVDERVLRESGFTVVDDPRAFLEVDEGSVIISVAPDIPVREIVADIARPAMMIWDKAVVRDRSVIWADPMSLRVEQMIEEYVELPFPGDANGFDKVSIYIRKGAWEDAVSVGPAS